MLDLGASSTWIDLHVFDDTVEIFQCGTLSEAVLTKSCEAVAQALLKSPTAA